MSRVCAITAAIFMLFTAQSFAGSDGSNTGEGVPDASNRPVVNVFASPTCSCCKGWADSIKTYGFDVQVHPTNDMQAKKDELGVPENVRSCHTATVNGMFVEGHVPASEIHKLIAHQQERPDTSMAGIAVPGMPHGSPGMETGRRDNYHVIGVTKDKQFGVLQTYTGKEAHHRDSVPK